MAAEPPVREPSHRCGTVALVGRPNVGKSTLVNALTGYKVSIVAPKPQTTRHRILGVVTRPYAQIALLDTPGLHAAQGKQALSRYLNRAARGAIADAQLLAWVVEAGRWNTQDQNVLAHVAAANLPVILVLNKIDKLEGKSALLPIIDEYRGRMDFAAMLPVSAKREDGLEALVRAMAEHLPPGPPTFDADIITDRSERFLAGELVREQLVRLLQEEMPYATSVTVESFERLPHLLRIQALIWVERDGQKAIVLGARGETIKRIGTQARKAIERQFGMRAYLGLHVRVRAHWCDDEQALKSLGYYE